MSNKIFEKEAMAFRKLKRDNYIILLSKKDFYKYHIYRNFISNSLQNKEAISQALFEKFLDIFENMPHIPVLRKKDNEKIKQIVDKTVERFSGKVRKRENYSFESRKRVKELPPEYIVFGGNNTKLSTTRISTINLRDMILNAVTDIYTQQLISKQETLEGLDKKEFLINLYRSLGNYRKIYLDEQTKKDLSHYKLIGFAAYIGREMGYVYYDSLPKNGKYHSCNELNKNTDKILKPFKSEFFKIKN